MQLRLHENAPIYLAKGDSTSLYKESIFVNVNRAGAYELRPDSPHQNRFLVPWEGTERRFAFELDLNF